MAGGNQPRYAEPMSMSEVESYLFEAIATAEQAGRAATRAQVAALSDLDDDTLDRTLHAMTGRGLITQDGDSYHAVKSPLPPGMAGNGEPVV